MSTKNLPATLPGYFTGAYIGKVSNLPAITSTQVQNTQTKSFAEVLDKVSTDKEVSQLTLTKFQIQNIPNSLPFTSMVASEIGPYGLIFARTVFRLCQYYKKTSPIPRF